MTSPRPSRKPRRRAFRVSDSVDYDRTADRPDFVSAFDDEGNKHDRSGDAHRDVQLDEESDDSPRGDEFWKEQVPPHYGGES